MANQEHGNMLSIWQVWVKWLSICDFPCTQQCPASLVWLKISIRRRSTKSMWARWYQFIAEERKDLYSLFIWLSMRSTRTRISELAMEPSMWIQYGDRLVHKQSTNSHCQDTYCLSASNLHTLGNLHQSCDTWKCYPEWWSIPLTSVKSIDSEVDQSKSFPEIFLFNMSRRNILAFWCTNI